MEREFVPRTLDAADPELCVLAVRADGQSLSAADRDRLLSEMRANRGPTRVTLEALVFLQRDTPNRNFVRFKPGLLKKFAQSFVGRPFLRDHEQRELSARGGTVIASELVEHKGVPAIAQTLELVKPWAIEAALDGTISTFSIGWHNTADVECSACGEPLARSIFGAMPSCSHFPGDKFESKDGETRYVEMLVTGAEGVETSAVSVPAVPGTGIGEIRAALAAERVRVALAQHQEKPMKHVCQKLGIAENADEASILAAVDKLRLDKDAAVALHAAEAQAHNAAKAKVAELDAELAVVRKADRDKALAALVDATQRKVGKGELGKPVVDIVLQLAEVSIEKAQEYVGRLAQAIPIGGPLQSRGTEPEPKAGELTAQQKKIARQLKLTDEQYLKTLNASSKEG